MTYVPKHSIFDKVAKKMRVIQNVNRLDFKLERPLVSVTFDDFPRTAVTVGAKGLEDYGWTGTFYTCAAMANTTNHHGLQFAPEDLPALEAKGHEIAGHTYEHVDCTQFDDDALLAQIDQNKNALRAMGVKGPIENFAFPFGQLSAGLKKKFGERFVSLRGIVDGHHEDSADLNELKSCGYYSSTAYDVIARIQDLKTRPKWLTIFTHDIQENPTEWGCTPAEYAALLAAIKDCGADVLPINRAISQLGARHDK